MKDIQLYEQILGLEKPWHVTDVRLDHTAQELRVRVECEEQVWACPECAGRMHVHGSEAREWRHLDTCQYRTIIECRVPRIRCEQHGTQMVRVPWAEKHGRFTRLFERFAIDVLKEMSKKGACTVLRTTWDEADGIVQRAVDRGLARKRWKAPRAVCFDEKAAARGHHYVTVATKVEGGRATVDDVIDGRGRDAADAYWKRFTEEERAEVGSIGMDMWRPYFDSAVAHVPGAAGKIVYDRYHVMEHLNGAVDAVRREEHLRLMAKGDDQLKQTRFLWLYGKENIPHKARRTFKELLAGKLKTAKAWMLKELFRDMYDCADRDSAAMHFKDWCRQAMRSRLEPLVRVARMVKAHAPNILTWFTHRLSNSFSEGINNLIQTIVKKAYGYRNRERFKRDILFHAGGLDLYPTN